MHTLTNLTFFPSEGAFFESNFKTKVDKLIQTFLDDQRASTFRMSCFRNLYINMKNIFGGLPKVPDELGGYPFKSWWFYKVVKNKKLKAVKERLVSGGEIKVEQPLLSLTDGRAVDRGGTFQDAGEVENKLFATNIKLWGDH